MGFVVIGIGVSSGSPKGGRTADRAVVQPGGNSMKQAMELEEADEVDDVPVSAGLRVLRPSRYGSIADLEDEELADPDELERQVWLEEYGPLLELPVRTQRGFIKPNIEDGVVNWGAFGTVDFDRIQLHGFDKARYKADRLSEELKRVLIMFSTVSDRIQNRAKYKVLKYLKMGYLMLEDIVHPDMHALGVLYLRARKLQQEIARLQKASRARRVKRLRPYLESWGLMG
jgi:hypothetical protein